MQYVKAIAFTALDWVLRAKIASSATTARRRSPRTSARSKTATPRLVHRPRDRCAASMKPMVHPAARRRRGVDRARPRPVHHAEPRGSAGVRHVVHIRADKGRRRRVILRQRSGTTRQMRSTLQGRDVEPVSASGEAGPGVIPRAPEVIRRVVAGFNGGFQPSTASSACRRRRPLSPRSRTQPPSSEMRDGSPPSARGPRRATSPTTSCRTARTSRRSSTRRVQPVEARVGGAHAEGVEGQHPYDRSASASRRRTSSATSTASSISADILANGDARRALRVRGAPRHEPGARRFEFYDVQPAKS